MTSKKPITQAQESIIDDLQTALPYLQSALEATGLLPVADLHTVAYGEIVNAIQHCTSASDYLNEVEDA